MLLKNNLNCIFCNSNDVDVTELHSDDSWPVIRTECRDCGAEGEEH